MGGSWPSVRGYEVSSVWLDEASHINPRGAFSADWASPPQQVSKKKIVDPLEIICRRCNAAVGQRCTDTNRRRTFERKPHRRRKDDARLVQEAANALLTRRRLSAP